MKQDFINIDGSRGEGGGQIVRTSLSLSMLTGKPVRIKKIRSKRNKPGLLRQHLTALQASAKICNATVTGAELGSREITFVPDDIKSGNYAFAIGSAGSTILVLQTIIPVLIFVKKPSIITIKGGTHNMKSPPFEFFNLCFLPILRKMGIKISATLNRYGFYPAGGGELVIEIEPSSKLSKISLLSRGMVKKISAESLFAFLHVDIAKRELKYLGEKLELPKKNLHITQVRNAKCSGNLVFVKLEFDNITEIISSFGARGISAEEVAKRAYNDSSIYLNSNAAVGEHLADQLLLYICLAGGGEFTTVKPTMHTTSNIEVIKTFLDCNVELKQIDEKIWKMEISK
jgi:RNA 3'-terminal phosphate cyclase (ATP)